MSMNSLFDQINSISYSKVDNFNEETYAPFLVNRAFSFYTDTVIIANLFNIFNNVPKSTQYKTLRVNIRPRKRFSGKWPKVNRDLAMKYAQLWKVGVKEAETYLKLLEVKDLEQLSTD